MTDLKGNSCLQLLQFHHDSVFMDCEKGKRQRSEKDQEEIFRVGEEKE